MELKCPICNNHLFVKKTTPTSVVFTCRNMKCPNCQKDVMTRNTGNKSK